MDYSFFPIYNYSAAGLIESECEPTEDNLFSGLQSAVAAAAHAGGNDPGLYNTSG